MNTPGNVGRIQYPVQRGASYLPFVPRAFRLPGGLVASLWPGSRRQMAPLPAGGTYSALSSFTDTAPDAPDVWSFNLGGWAMVWRPSRRFSKRIDPDQLRCTTVWWGDGSVSRFGYWR